MRTGRLLLAAAAVCAAAHVAGILVADPLWRYAEVLSIALLLACAVRRGAPGPRWVVPAALVVLLADAVRTVPAEPGTGGYGWRAVTRIGEVAMSSGFSVALSLTWASLTAVALLLAVRRRGGWRRRPMAVAAVAAVAMTAYAVVRLFEVWSGVRAAQPWILDDVDEVMAGVSLAVLPALTLGLAALALAASLAGHGRWLASAGAALLAVVALPHLDAGIVAISLPMSVADGTALFAWHAISPTLAVPQPVPALTAAVELTAYLLLVAGLTGRGRRVGEPAGRPLRRRPASASERMSAGADEPAGGR
ncbi:hypothetical protein [Micromonospora sp. KLBMP9576]|uniref:hypothetical protein n=1 Tax=Micromonospora sp. KLBMP9576 TaxID=3424769 RepID=UPI003D8BF825